MVQITYEFHVRKLGGLLQQIIRQVSFSNSPKLVSPSLRSSATLMPLDDRHMAPDLTNTAIDEACLTQAIPRCLSLVLLYEA